jgi:hypothetical protein
MKKINLMFIAANFKKMIQVKFWLEQVVPIKLDILI